MPALLLKALAAAVCSLQWVAAEFTHRTASGEALSAADVVHLKSVKVRCQSSTPVACLDGGPKGRAAEPPGVTAGAAQGLRQDFPAREPQRREPPLVDLPHRPVRRRASDAPQPLVGWPQSSEIGNTTRETGAEEEDGERERARDAQSTQRTQSLAIQTSVGRAERQQGESHTPMLPPTSSPCGTEDGESESSAERQSCLQPC